VPRNWLLRLKVVVLAALLVSGGGGMPVLDIALFHLGVPGYSRTTHVEASGSPHSHLDQCRLGTGLSYTPVPERLDVVTPVVGLGFCEPLQALDSPLPSANVGLLPQPRAPPAHQA
jgi:hypothetical protein